MQFGPRPPMLDRVRRSAWARLFRRFLQNGRKIGTETKCNEKLSKDVHRADQHLHRIVKQRRPLALNLSVWCQRSILPCSADGTGRREYAPCHRWVLTSWAWTCSLHGLLQSVAFLHYAAAN